MLIIRKEQMAIFEAHLARRFREDLRRHVTSEFPSETRSLADGGLEKLLSEGIGRARAYGLTAERDLTLFVDLLFLLGVNFDRDRKFAWARRILLDETLEGTARMEAIYQRLAAFDRALPATAS